MLRKRKKLNRFLNLKKGNPSVIIPKELLALLEIKQDEIFNFGHASEVGEREGETGIMAK